MAAIELGSTTLFSDANLVAYYKLEDVSDSKNSNTLTNNNTVTFNAAKFNNGADGGSANTNKYLNIASKLSYVNSAYSMAGWVKIETEPTSAQTQCFCEIKDSVSKTSFCLDYFNSGGTLTLEAFHLRAGVAAENAQFNVALGTINFHHVAAVIDGSNVILYLDSVNVAQIAFNSGSGSSALTDGMTLLTDRNISNFTKGIQDDWGFFNRALTPSEISLLFNGPSSGGTMTTNTKFWGV